MTPNDGTSYPIDFWLAEYERTREERVTCRGHDEGCPRRNVLYAFATPGTCSCAELRFDELRRALAERDRARELCCALEERLALAEEVIGLLLDGMRNGKPVAALVLIDQEALEDWVTETVGVPPVRRRTGR